MLRFRFAWLAKAVWAIGGAGITFLALVLPRVYTAGASTTERDDKIVQVQQQVLELQGQIDRLETEVEWLIRHNADAKEAPLESPEEHHSWMRLPDMTQEQRPQDSNVPQTYESILGGNSQ